MIDIFLELIFLIFGVKSSKKVKKWFEEIKKKKKEASQNLQKEKNIATGKTVASCTGCNRILKEPPVYEQGKPWCQKCYKTQVLKLR